MRITLRCGSSPAKPVRVANVSARGSSPLVKAQCDVKSSYIAGSVGCIVRERRLSPWRKDDLCQKSAVVVRPPRKKVFRRDSNERLRK